MGDLSGRQWLFSKSSDRRIRLPGGDRTALRSLLKRTGSKPAPLKHPVIWRLPPPVRRTAKTRFSKSFHSGPHGCCPVRKKAAAGLAPWLWPFDFLEIYQVVSDPKAAAVPMAAHIVGSAAPVNRLFCGNVKSARQSAANALELQSKIRSSRSRHGYRIHDVRLPKLRESPAQHPLLTPARLGNRA